MDRTSMDMLVRHNVWVLSGRPSGSHRERVLSRISPAQSVYRMIEVTSGKKPVAPEILGTTSVHLRSRNFVGFRCTRHQQKQLVFFPTCFASRGRRNYERNCNS